MKPRAPFDLAAGVSAGALGSLLGHLADAALSMDADSRARLARLHGRSLCLHATDLGSTWRVEVLDGHLSIGPEAPATTDASPPNVIVAASGAELALWLASGGQRGEVRVDGDIDTLGELVSVARGFDPVRGLGAAAPDSPLGVLLDTPAAHAALGALEFAGATLRAMADTAADAARAAGATAFADRNRFDRLLDRLDAAALRLDRLEARAARREREPGKPPAE